MFMERGERGEDDLSCQDSFLIELILLRNYIRFVDSLYQSYLFLMVSNVFISYDFACTFYDFLFTID